MKFKFRSLLISLILLLVGMQVNYIYAANENNKTDVVIFGDSITYKGNWNELFPDLNIVNLGIEGDTAYNLKKRIGQVYRYNPKYCVILVGFNDICCSKDDVDFIYKNYTYVLKKLMQRNITPVIMSTTYANEKLKNYKEVNNKIYTLNNKLQLYAADNNINFIDLNKYLSKNKLLLKEYAADHVHLNQKAYKVWRNEIKGIINK